MDKVYYTNQTDPKTGTVYVYEGIAYYDSSAGRMRYRSRKVIGHIDKETGELVKNRPWHRQEQIEIAPIYFGANYLVSHILKVTNLVDDLKLMSEADYSNIIAVASYYAFACVTDTINFEDWISRNFIENCNGLSSQSISELFVTLSRIDTDAFFVARFKSVKNVSLFIDTTLISTDSDDIVLGKLGKDKDEIALPQINLAMVLDSTTNYPVCYEEFPGNIDIDLIKQIVSKTANHGIEKLRLCLDNGFYSESNIEALVAEGFDFLIGLKPSTNALTRLIAKYTRDIRFDECSGYDIDTHTQYLQFDYPITCKSRTDDNAIAQHTETLKLNIYYSVDRHASEHNAFQDKLAEIKMHLLDVNPNKKLQKLINKYYIKTDNGYQKNSKVIAEESKYFGYFLILSSEKNLTAKEVLDIYSSKDKIEETFSMLKNKMHFPALRAHKDETFRGKLLCMFVAFIMRTELRDRFKKANLPRKETFEDALDEIAMIKGKCSKTGKNKYMSASKKQNDYLQALGIPIIKD
ncbi:MAG: transposase [Christensenellaceae bacterium]|jgi:transposase|nr:transposase [Christensenellaceae bacterium]